jgi:hypothetical protein
MTASHAARILLATLSRAQEEDTTMPTIERIAKTPKAWEALSRPDLIGRQAHTLLLMANGRRSEKELSLLLGDDVSELAYGLRQQGYLQTAAIRVLDDEDDNPTA